MVDLVNENMFFHCYMYDSIVLAFLAASDCSCRKCWKCWDFGGGGWDLTFKCLSGTVCAQRMKSEHSNPGVNVGMGESQVQEVSEMEYSKR